MYSLTFPYSGAGRVFLQYSGDGLDVAQGLPAAVLQPPSRWMVYYSQGQNTGLVAGVTLTGQTSGAVIKVVSVVTTAGAMGTTDAVGILFYELTQGSVAVVAAENLRVSTTTYCVTMSAQMDAPVGLDAKAAILTVESNTIRATVSGVNPTNTAGSGVNIPASWGHAVTANNSMMVSGWNDVNGLRFINAAASANAVVNITVSY